ncbi:MAG: hypothetical protein WA102_13100 [Candidatus Methanoperedens sp.]
MIKKRPLLLMILDGYGLRDSEEANAIAAAKKPNLDKLFSSYPHSKLDASGESVGLPEGQMRIFSKVRCEWICTLELAALSNLKYEITESCCDEFKDFRPH